MQIACRTGPHTDPEFERISPNSQQRRRRRLATLAVQEDLEQRFGGQGMAGVAGVTAWKHSAHFKRCCATNAGINKQHLHTTYQIQRMFDLQLVVFQKLDVLARIGVRRVSQCSYKHRA